MKLNKIHLKRIHLKEMKWTGQRKILAAVSGILVVALLVGVIAASGTEKETVTYKETTVAFGNLVVGVTESGAVDIGTVEQTFDLDMSALQRAETGTDSSGSAGNGGAGGFGAAMPGGGAQGGGMDMFSQIFGMSSGGNASTNQEDTSLTVSEVCVSVGQQVAEGDVLYYLEEESVLELEQELQSNVEKAEADLEAVYAEQTLSKQKAEYNLESSTAYGSYAETEYNTTIQELQDSVQSSLKSLNQAKESLTDYEAQLASITTSYDEAAQVLANCEWSLNNVNVDDDLYGYIYYFELHQTAQSTADSLEQQKEQLTRSVEQAEQNVETATKAYNTAQRNLEQGLLTAQQTLSLRQLAYNTAQETYDIALAYLEEDVTAQEETCQKAKDKWEEFSSHINGNSVCAQYDGVITGVNLAAGDSIRTGDVLVTLYNMDEVTMTVTVDEADMTNIAVGSKANISFTAYPDTVFTAAVTEISDATSDSDGNVTYEVTVTLEGDVSGLFQSMTGDITFVTEQVQEVLYVSKRAIMTSGEKTYVKVKTEDGDIEKRTVTTGFTDGVNIEIVEGLSEGDIVLIESRVSNS